MRTRIALVLLALALPASAVAAPVPISPREIQTSPTSLAFDATGDGLASWRGLHGGNPDAGTLFQALASRTPAGTWSVPLTLPVNVTTHAVTLYGAGRVALVTTREQRAGKARTRTLVTLSLGTANPLSLGPTRVFYRGPRRHVGYDGPAPSAFSPLVAATPSGTVLIAWQRTDVRAKSGIWATTAGGTPRRLGPYGGTPSLALAPDGSGLLSWRRGSVLYARVRHANGTWGGIERAGIVARYAEVSTPVLAGSGGRWAMASTEDTRSGDGVHFRPSIHVRVPGAGWRGAKLDEGTFVPTGDTAYVIDHLETLTTLTPDGHFHVAWPAPRGDAVLTAVADIDADASGVHVRMPQLFGHNVALDGIAPGSGDRWAVSWFDTSSPEGTPNLVQLGGAGTQVTPGLATERSVLDAPVAYDPSTGRPVVIWSQGDAQSGYQVVSSA
jgi:hypothetical protein